MYSWKYNEKILKDIIYNHAQDFGRFYCELMLDSPNIYKEFMKGFQNELERRTQGNDSPTTDKDGASGE